MSTQIILKVLALRHRLRQRDHWTRRQLKKHQGRGLRLLRKHAYARSPFYGHFHKRFTDRPLNELPILTKEMVMEHFDELITDPTVRLADVETHLTTLSGGDEFLGGRYRVASTSGSTGRPALFLWDPGEWASVLASYNRSFDWADVGAGLTHRTRMAVVSSTTPWHRSARVGASVSSPWVPTLRIDSGDPLESIVERLGGFQPRVLVAYASMAHLLATSPRCPCGRPFALIDGIQGRAEDVLRFPATSGGQVSVQPIIFHRVMDTVPAGAWQVVQGPEGLPVLLSGVREGFAEATLIDSLRQELGAQGAIVPLVKVRRVPTIPRTTVGKAPLIKARVPGPQSKP